MHPLRPSNASIHSHPTVCFLVSASHASQHEYNKLFYLLLQELPVAVRIVHSIVLISQKLVQEVHHLDQAGVTAQQLAAQSQADVRPMTS